MNDTDHHPIETIRLSPRDKQRLVETLDQQSKLSKVDREKRNIRADYHSRQVAITLVQASGLAVRHQILSRNLSRWGIAFIHGQYVYDNTRCEITLPLLDGETYTVLGQTVRCRHVGGIVHEVSIRFDEPIELDLFVALTTEEIQRHSQERSDDLASSAPAEVECDLRALVVDHQRIERKLYGLWLSEIGLRSSEAIGAEHVLGLVLREPTDLILIDHVSDSREADGCTLVRQIRDAGFNGAIVGMSSDESDQMREQMLEAGCNTFMPKPFDKAALQVVIEQLLSLAGGQSDVAEPIFSTQADVESMRPLVRDFVQGVGEHVASLHRAVRQEDYPQLTQVCLQLKTAAGFGFDRVTEGARQTLEGLDETNRDLETVKSSVDELIEILRRVQFK